MKYNIGQAKFLGAIRFASSFILHIYYDIHVYIYLFICCHLLHINILFVHLICLNNCQNNKSLIKNLKNNTYIIICSFVFFFLYDSIYNTIYYEIMRIIFQNIYLAKKYKYERQQKSKIDRLIS